MKTLKEFWLDVAREQWAVQDFTVSPDDKGNWASCHCIFHGKKINAHLPALRMNGEFSITFRHSTHEYEAMFHGPYRYVGRGQHRDACLGTLELKSLLHLGLYVANDGILPEKPHICMKFSDPCDKMQQDDADNLKTWSSFENICSQFPRLLHFASFKKVAGVARSVLLVEAMGDGGSVGAELQKIENDPVRKQSRETFVLCMRFMMWAFELQKEHVKAQNAYLQDVHMNNCVILHGEIAGYDPANFLGRAGRHTKFRCIDSNGWWDIGCHPWKDLAPLFGCITDVVATHFWRNCRLHAVHIQAVDNVAWRPNKFMPSFFLGLSCIFFIKKCFVGYFVLFPTHLDPGQFQVCDAETLSRSLQVR